MIWAKLLAVFWRPMLAVAALVATWLGGRRAAKTDAKVAELKETVEALEDRDEVENRIAVERDSRQRLRDEWQRGD